MKLQEVFDQFKFGELSQLSIGGNNAGEINEKNWPNLIAHINIGLTALYKRFNLKQGRLKLQLYPEISLYQLSQKFATTSRGGMDITKYLLDTPTNKFKDDVLKIERVYTEGEHELKLNDVSDLYSLHTPSMTSLLVPNSILSNAVDLPDELKTTSLSVVYRANHNLIVKGIGYFDPNTVDLELPYSHLDALLLYVASRVHNPIGLVNEFNFGNTYAAKYEQACQMLELQNLEIDEGSQNTRINRNGWV